jgi:RHS repeat-associated protein
VPTTTYSYDNNGNLIQAGGWSYMWDYLNRMLASGYANSTTTYAYDPSGARVLQTSTTSTTYYPNKYYSFTSTKSGANTYATSTNYVFNGDTLLATIDQALYNGAATGSPITRYIHPDHLGSTNAVTDQNGALVQLMDYYPYGTTRIATSTYPTNEKRQYIGQYSDTGTGLSYLNARYYNPQQGQFLSEDPVFLGNPIQQNLLDPQYLNAYSYALNNPITKKDPSGQCPLCVTALLGAGAGMTGQYIIDVSKNLQTSGLSAGAFTTNLSSPQTYLTRAMQGAVIGGTGGLAADVVGPSLVAQSALVGGTSGATGIFANAYLGEPVTPQSVFFDTTFGALTLGLGEFTPGIRGRLPKFGTEAFFTGAHTQQNALRVGVDAGSSYLSYAFSEITTNQARVSAANSFNAAIGSGSGGGGQPSNNSLWVTPSGAVVTWGGQLIIGPTAQTTPTTTKK